MTLTQTSLFGLSLVFVGCFDTGSIGSTADGGRGTTGGSGTLGGYGGLSETGGAGGLQATGGTAEGGTAPSGGTAGSAGVLNLAARTLTSCGIETVGSPELSEISVPSELWIETSGPMWGPIIDDCVAGGWDLSPCAGSTATLVRWLTTDVSSYPPVGVNVYLIDDTVCCVLRTEQSLPGWLVAPCGPLVPPRQALRSCGIPATRLLGLQTIAVPAELTGPNWGIKATACQEGGWDLAQCAGQNATFTAYETTATSPGGRPWTAWVVSLGSTVCCVYESDESTPGIYAAPCQRDGG